MRITITSDEFIYADTLIIFSTLPLPEIRRIFNEPKDIFSSDIDKNPIVENNKIQLTELLKFEEVQNHEKPEHINCQGCRVEGIKTVFCDSLCDIRQCALKKGVTTCGDCPDMGECQIVGVIIANNPEALENLKR